MRTIYDNVFSSTNPKEVLNFKLEENLKPKRKDGSFLDKDIPYASIKLCDTIFGIIEPIKNKEFDTKIGVLYSIEMAILLHFYGFKDVTIITTDYDPYIADRTDSFCYKYLLLDEVVDMKFDVIVGNPPYNRNLHLDFLTTSHHMLNANGSGVLIHPGSWLLNEVPGLNKVKEACKFADEYVHTCEFRPSMDCFDIDLGVPVSITQFTKQRNVGIKVVDNSVTHTTYEVSNTSFITKHGNNPLYVSIKNKVRSDDTLRTHLKTDGRYYVCMSTLMGNGDGGNFKVNAPFYAFAYKKNAFVRDELPEGSTRYFGFNAENEAENFLNYIKGYFARFCLSIAKFDRSLNPITLTTTPWMDFTQEWTDEKLFKHFGITEEEQNFIMQFIPRFYD